jgi:hypothetical protein
MIGGPGRSGTNILKEIFRAHPLVLGHPFETRFTVDPDGLAPTLRLLRSSVSPFVGETALARLDRLLTCLATRSVADRFAATLESVGITRFTHRRYRDWQLNAVFPDFLKCKDALIRDLTRLSYAGIWAGAPSRVGRATRRVAHNGQDERVITPMRTFLRTIYFNAINSAHKQYFVDDNTYNILYGRELLDLLPQGRLIHVVRDPRDVVASYLHQRWTPRSLPAALEFYSEVMRRWLSIRDTIDPSRFMEIRLEDLCHDPESVLVKISEWAQIPFDDALLSVDLTQSNSGRWRREFGDESQQLLARELKPFIDQFNYEP